MKVWVILITGLMSLLLVSGCATPQSTDGSPDEGSVAVEEAVSSGSEVDVTENESAEVPVSEPADYGVVSETDVSVYEDLVGWIEQKDRDGWTIPGQEGVTFDGLLKGHSFHGNVLELAVDTGKIGVVYQRSLMEMVARKWISLYPADEMPVRALRVILYDGEIDHNKELGYSEIDSERIINTVHYSTQD